MTAIRSLSAVTAVLISVTLASSQIASLPATLELRQTGGITIAFQNGMPLPTFEKQRRTQIDLKGVWRKQRFSADHSISLGKRDSSGYAALVLEASGRTLPAYDDGSWLAKIVPGVENTLSGIVNTPPEGYEDGVWYRRSFTVPDSLNGHFARLMFYAVNYVADVWLNGIYLGYHEGGYTPFALDATGALRFDTTNVLVVRVDNPAWGSRDDVVPYGTLQHKPDWFNYTGIIHDVYLEFSNRFSISRAEVIPQDIHGQLEATVVLWNRTPLAQNATLALEVSEANVDSLTIQSEYPADLIGAPVASSPQIALSVPADSGVAWRGTMSIPSVKLWSPKHPNLYVLRASLTVDGVPTDEVCTQFGVRTLGITGSTLLLNDKPMFFPGVARHEDHYLYGRSVPAPVIYSDLKMVRDLNATFLRTAHYPNHPATYLFADRLGIAVLEEIPVWWFDEADAWLKQDFIRHIHEQMFREMVFRDRNRPSILFWSTCNECLDQTNRGNFIQRLNTELDSQYPDGRFVTQSAAADRPGPSDPTQLVCDVAGWTMYFGIFHGGTYYDGTRAFLASAKASNPNKPILDTEFGYWSREDFLTAPVQLTVFDSTFMAFNEFVAVDSSGIYHAGNPLTTTTWWAAFDWYTVQTGNQTMGLYMMDHATPKPVAARLRDVYRPFKASSETAVINRVASSPVRPSEMILEQNYPNPFNPSTTIVYQIAASAHVRLEVINLLGQVIATLFSGQASPGRYAARFDGSLCSSGVYFFRLTSAGRAETRKMLLVR